MIVLMLPTGNVRGQMVPSSAPGRQRFQASDGRILSIQGDSTPVGAIGWRTDPSSDGAFEQGQKLADCLAYVFDWNGQQVNILLLYREVQG
jgi:hypothetical protein